MNNKKVIDCIRKNKRFLISAHTNLEGDAIGSELAFYNLVRRLGKKATVVNEDEVPYGYDFLPFVEAIKKYRHGMRVPDFDVFVAVDCSDLKRTGQVYMLNDKKKTVLNRDHHISNSFFGDINWVEPDASCCCEQIYELYKQLGVTLDKDSALLLYTGILTDTGSFKYSNTDSKTHMITAELLGHSINVPLVFKNIYGNIPVDDLKLLVEVLPTMQTAADGRVVWFEFHKELLKRHNKISFDLSENVLSFGRSIKGVEVVILFKENLTKEGEVRVNFRSEGKVDVNRIAGFFTGGGHKTAAGATMKGNLKDIERKVLKRVKASLA